MTTTPQPDLKPGFIRTATPFIAGLIGSWLTRQGLDINDDFLSAALVFVFGYLYYVVARLGEVYGSSNWSYILGFTKTRAIYATPPAVVTDETGRRRVQAPDEGVMILWLLGVILATVGAVLLLFGALDGVVSKPGVVLLVVGAVLAYLDRDAPRR